MLALPNVVAKFRYGKDRKSDAKAWQTWQQGQKVPVDHGYVMQTASATLKAVR